MIMNKQSQDTNMTFLLGAGRSGSTLLYKLLSMHPKVGYISSYNNSLPNALPTGYLNRLLAKHVQLKRQVWFEKGGNAHGFQRNVMKRLVPWPVEGENVYARAGIALFEGEKQVLEQQPAQQLRQSMLRLLHQQNADGMLSKRVANNRRIPWLKKAFPEAKFIHLIRDGRDVAYSFSQVGWWNANTRVWWAGKTMQELVEHEGWDELSVTARTWVEAMQTVEKDLKEVDESQVLRVRYEDLLKKPLQVLDDILTFMQVGDSEDYIEQVKCLNLRPVEPKWKKSWDADAYAKVLKQQQSELAGWGYM